MRRIVYIKARSLTRLDNQLTTDATLDSCRRLLLSKRKIAVYSEVFFLVPESTAARTEYEFAKIADADIKRQIAGLNQSIKKLEMIKKPTPEDGRRLDKARQSLNELRKKNRKNNKILREWKNE